MKVNDRVVLPGQPHDIRNISVIEQIRTVETDGESKTLYWVDFTRIGKEARWYERQELMRWMDVLADVTVHVPYSSEPVHVRLEVNNNTRRIEVLIDKGVLDGELWFVSEFSCYIGDGMKNSQGNH